MNNSYLTKASILKKAKELVESNITFGELNTNNRISKKNKGDLGQLIEESWFGYKPNNDSDPDFKEAGVELKVSPYKVLKNGEKSAKERLVCNLIDYISEANKTFDTSSFWKKCKCICLISYKWEKDKEKSELSPDHATLFDSFPEEDLIIIKRDWKIINDKIKAGEAHLISEGDTYYLAACEKGENASRKRKQPFSNIEATQRAYSLKTTYITHLLRKYIFGVEENEHIITDYRILEKKSIEEILLAKFKPYYGKTLNDIKIILGLEKINAKHTAAIITSKILNIKSIEKTEEFVNANIKVKTIKINKEGMPYEAMSFPAFEFDDLIAQKNSFVDSDCYNEIVSSKMMAVIFKGNKKNPKLYKIKFWNIPYKDVKEVKRVWERTINIIENGVVLTKTKTCVTNNLPKSTESYLMHVRPHSSKIAYKFEDGTTLGNIKSYGSELPDGRWMTKQCFWLNKEYILKEIINDK